MKPEVRQGWLDFNTPLEGYSSWLYLDVKGFVTTGVGNLVDTIADAQALPWRRKDGTPATPEEVAGAWRFVKAQQSLRNLGGGAFARLTTIRLARQTVVDMVAKRLRVNEVALRVHFPDFESWSADAQMLVLSMAWAMGPDFPRKFPKFSRYMRAGDYASILRAKEYVISTVGNPGVQMRNEANEKLLERLVGVVTIDVV